MKAMPTLIVPLCFFVTFTTTDGRKIDGRGTTNLSSRLAGRTQFTSMQIVARPQTPRSWAEQKVSAVPPAVADQLPPPPAQDGVASAFEWGGRTFFFWGFH